MTNYHETPENFSNFSNCFKSNDVLFDLLNESNTKIVFYDTCSFRYHSNLNANERKAIVDYIKSNNYLLIFITTIVMELGQDSGIYERVYVDYFKELNNAQIKMFFVNEEKLYDNARNVYPIDTIKEQLRHAVYRLKRPKSIGELAHNFYNDFFFTNKDEQNVVDRFSISDFFVNARKNKTHDDDLGEQMIFLCVYLLSQIPPIYKNKIYVFTDDKGAAMIFKSAYCNCPRNHTSPRIFNIIKIVEELYRTNIIADKSLLESIIKSVKGNNIIISYCTELSNKIETKNISCNELIEEITKLHSLNILS